jgi:hypothetical protein
MNESLARNDARKESYLTLSLSEGTLENVSESTGLYLEYIRPWSGTSERD